MRSLVISLILFIIVLSTVILNAVFIQRTAEAISDIAVALPYSSNIAADAQRLSDLWRHRRSLVSLSVKAKDTERMDSLVLSLESAVEQNRFSDIKLLCKRIITFCDDIRLYESVSFHSLF